jgi:outer membrane receptor protein involved in Fe transport
MGNKPRLSGASLAAGLAGFGVIAALPHTAAAQGAENQLEEVFVTGSRVIRSGFDSPTPVTVIGADYLENLGLVNVGEAVQQLPLNKAQFTPLTNGWGSFNIGAQIINLRGLGPTRTLTLVDGRRHIPSTDSGTVDLNMIPSLLLARTEVVTGGASAAYGSDALSGVVNVILDKQLDGFRWQADYGISGQSDGASKHLSLAGGLDLFGGRGHIIVGADYEDSEGIDSCIRTRDWCASRPGSVTNFASAVNGQPRVIITDDVLAGGMTSAGAIAFRAPGDPLSGIQFDAGGNPTPYTPGQYVGFTQQGGDGFSFYETTNIRVPVERYSVMAHLDYELSDATNFFAEFSTGHVYGENLGSARWFNSPSTSFTIQRDNAFLHPDIAQIMDDNGIASFQLAKHWDDWGRILSVSENDAYRLLLGADGDINSGWRWDSYYQYGEDERTQSLKRSPIGSGPDGPTPVHQRPWRAIDAVLDPGSNQIVCRETLSNPALAAADPGCVPLNPFGLNQWDTAARDWVLGTLWEWYDMKEHVVAANLYGDIFEVGGGPVGVAAGVEFRKDTGSVTHDECSLVSCYWLNYGDDFAGELEVTEGYVEAAVPFLRDRVGAKLFELDVAVRQTHYRNTRDAHTVHSGPGAGLAVAEQSRTIDATTWKFSTLYDPIDMLRFRATRSRDIRAPNFDELYSLTASQLGQINNPWTGMAENPIVIGGGNVNLDAESGDTTTFGVVVTPTGGALEGLRFSLDYWNIKLDGAVGTLGTQSIIDGCFTGNGLLCGLLDGAGGPLQQVRNVNLNLDAYETSGLDVEVQYQRELDGGANLGFVLYGTNTDELLVTVGGVSTDWAGRTAGSFGGFGTPDWNMNAVVNYSRERFGLSLQARYISDGVYNPTYVQPGDAGYDPASPFSINDNTVPSAVYTTLAGRYNFMIRGARTMELFMSISNLFDRDPPIVPDAFYPTSTVYFDQIGRTYRIGVRADF